MVSSLDKARRCRTQDHQTHNWYPQARQFHSLETRAKQAIEDIDIEEMKLLLQQAERTVLVVI